MVSRFAEGLVYGMKVYAGLDQDPGLIHSAVVMTVNVHDLMSVVDLLHGDEQVVYVNAGYQGIAKRPQMEGAKVEFRVEMRPGKRRALPDSQDGKLQELIEAANANSGIKVEPLFWVIKQQFGFHNTLVCNLAKKRCSINVLAALTILFLARRRLLTAVPACRWCVEAPRFRLGY